jgi:hypothetical protein
LDVRYRRSQRTVNVRKHVGIRCTYEPERLLVLRDDHVNHFSHKRQSTSDIVKDSSILTVRTKPQKLFVASTKNQCFSQSGTGVSDNSFGQWIDTALSGGTSPCFLYKVTLPTILIEGVGSTQYFGLACS